MCWVAQVFSFRPPATSSHHPFANPAIRRLFFPLTVPRPRTVPPFYCFLSPCSPFGFSLPARGLARLVLGVSWRVAPHFGSHETLFPSNVEDPRFQQSAHQEVKGKRQVNFVWGCSREALQLLTSRFVFCAWSLLLVTSRRLLVCGSTPAPQQEGVQSLNRAAAGRQREAWRCGKTQGVGSGWT